MLMTLLLTGHTHQVDSSTTPAKEACASLLWTNSAYDPEPTVSELMIANEWWKQLTYKQENFAHNLTRSPRFARFIRRHGIDLTKGSPRLTEELYGVRFLHEMKRDWEKISIVQRDAVLSLELKKIHPPPLPRSEADIPTHPLNGQEWLKTLSFENKARLLSQLQQRYPLPAGVVRNSALIATAKRMSEELNFQFVQRHRDDGRFDGMERPPLVSDREMRSLGWIGNTSYYSDLIGGSSTVDFAVEAVRGEQPLYNLHGRAAQVGVVLHRNTALRHGLMLPHFIDLQTAVNFVMNWDPEVLSRLFHRNRLLLPLNIVSPEYFAQFLGYGDLHDLFQSEELYDRFAPLRQSLHKYVLTVEDGETFLREAFARYLLAQNQRLNRDENKRFSFLQWKINGGAQSMYAISFQQWLGMSGFEVRVPIAVPCRDYSILRLNSRRYGGVGD